MITKEDILLWVCKLDDDYDELKERLDAIEKRVKKLEPKKGKKNEVTK